MAQHKRPVIIITHDECLFRANDDARKGWFEKGHNRMKKKHIGQSKMVSGFCCACHGWVHLAYFSPGKNQEGFWRNEDLVNQLKGDNGAIAKAKSLHPGCELVFVFDNSSNHHARPPTGLDAKPFNLSPGGKNFPTAMRNGYYTKDGVQVEQSFYDADGKAKGLMQTLRERGLYPAGGLKRDDAEKLLKGQPDFVEQREWLAEVVLAAGHQINYYPKFHCELNFIEKMWACAKSRARKECDYSFRSLELLVPKVLEEIPLEFFAKAFRSCSRYCMAYGNSSLTAEEVKYQHKKFSSHRKINTRMAGMDYN